MTRAELLEFADRIEREEPNRRLDEWLSGMFSIGAEVLPYTSSLDAAITLVPKGWGVLMAWSEDRAMITLSRKPLGAIDGQEWMQTVMAKTPAAALTAAALRAIALEMNDERT